MRTVGKVFKKKLSKKPNKKAVMEALKEKGIEFDEKLSVDELINLLPKGAAI